MSTQFGRKASLMVMRPDSKGNNPSAYVPGSVLDLSQMHFQFSTQNQDEEGPSNCSIRVFNLKEDTQKAIIKFDYSRVILQAGYEGSFGVIFDGTIKQFRTGRLSATDTYLDILAADGDIGYNFGVVNTTLAAGSTSGQRVAAAVDAMSQHGITLGADLSESGGVLPRGKVLFGMARMTVRTEAESRGCTWSIQNGKVQIIPLDGYLPGEAVKLTAQTGLIGLPRQTQAGIEAQCLLNPKIVVGGRVQIDNKSINQLMQQNGKADPVPYNSWAALQFLATTNDDGFYRVYVAEHEGDTRGQAWYTNLVCLRVNGDGKVSPYG